MKTSFVLTLFAVFLTAGAAELSYSKNVFSFPKSKSVLDAALAARDGRVLNSVTTQNTTHFYPIVEYGYFRSGTMSIFHYGFSIDKCIDYCRKSDSCLAVVYYHSGRQCYEVQTLGSFTTNSNYATVLVKTKKGDDPCNDTYAIKGRYRPSYYFEYFQNEQTPTPRDCCMKCREDPESRCKAWSYHVSGKYCYLLDATPLLVSSSSYITGYAVVD